MHMCYDRSKPDHLNTNHFFLALVNPLTMSCVPDMMPTSLVAVVAPRTGKIVKNGLNILK